MSATNVMWFKIICGLYWKQRFQILLVLLKLLSKFNTAGNSKLWSGVCINKGVFFHQILWIPWILSRETRLRTLTSDIWVIPMFYLVYFLEKIKQLMLEFLQWWGSHYLMSSGSSIVLLSKSSVRVFFQGAVIYLPIDSYYQLLFSLGLQN